ncbi:MAG: cell division protein FtsA [Solobacterium sp.]|nr:cell division protein FtsA [Solobacterium sp.]
MSDKQIFAAIELSDQEVRLVVGEFFNARMNILGVENVKCDGVTYSAVTNKDTVVSSIQKAKASLSKKLSVDIKRVILAIPSYHMKRFGFKSTVDIDGIDGTVTIQDIRNAIKKADEINIDKRLLLIQTTPVKYTVNGISARRMPIGDRCSQITVDMDLLCADRQLTYDYVSCIESAGLEVMDIFLDIYAIGKEAALFEQSIDQQVIVLKVERDATTLGLLKQGRYVSSAILGAGVGGLASDLTNQYGMSSLMSVESFKYHARLNQDKCSSNPVQLWQDDTETRTISEQELVDTVKKNINLWLDALEKTCVPILQAGDSTVIITGEGGEAEGLDALVKQRLGVEAKSYIPETLGGRYAGFTTALGLLYAYKDKLPISGSELESIDINAFNKTVNARNKKNRANKEDTLTNKFRSLFSDGKKNS